MCSSALGHSLLALAALRQLPLAHFPSNSCTQLDATPAHDSFGLDVRHSMADPLCATTGRRGPAPAKLAAGAVKDEVKTSPIGIEEVRASDQSPWVQTSSP